jgi:hypothetical protein
MIAFGVGHASVLGEPMFGCKKKMFERRTILSIAAFSWSRDDR